MGMSESNIVPIRALSDNEALAWIVGHGQMETTGTALARDWDWTRSKVRRRLASWSTAGLIIVKPARGGRTVISPVPKPMADHPATTVADHPTSTVTAAPAAVGHAVATRGSVDLLAYAVAIGLAGTAAYFSIGGMIVLFPGAPTAIVIMGLAMEVAKLVTVAFLARQWRRVGYLSRAVLVTLVAGLAAINAAGVYSQLVAAHLGDRVTATFSVATEASALTARTEVQSHTVADLDNRLGQIDAAIGEMVKRGRTGGALEAIGAQRKAREALVSQRRREAEVFANLKSEAGAIAARSRKIEVEAAPIMYVAQLMGGTTEQVIRLLILLIVLTCDPLALALTAAASSSNAKSRESDPEWKDFGART
jgi:hypothetical protein